VSASLHTIKEHQLQQVVMVLITLFNTQNVTETRLAEFENDTEIFSLALVFKIQLWPVISIFFN